jgi:hypothetical protein
LSLDNQCTTLTDIFGSAAPLTTVDYARDGCGVSHREMSDLLGQRAVASHGAQAAVAYQLGSSYCPYSEMFGGRAALQITNMR